MLETKSLPPVYSWNDINSGAATQIFTIGVPTATVAGKVTRGLLHSIVFNNPGASWEVDLYDGTSTSATSIGKVRPGATTTPFTLVFDIACNSGLLIDTVKGTTVGDMTVLYLNE